MGKRDQLLESALETIEQCEEEEENERRLLKEVIQQKIQAHMLMISNKVSAAAESAPTAARSLFRAF
jgi:hypothetical protein